MQIIIKIADHQCDSLSVYLASYLFMLLQETIAVLSTKPLSVGQAWF